MAHPENLTCASVSRRGFVGTLAALGLTGSSPIQAGGQPVAQACIWINLVGGPSQLDTFDPKPNAPAEVRGPFQSISTALPGVRLSELFPYLAHRLNQVTLLRGLHHTNLPTHEAGWQELQTGSYSNQSSIAPSLGAHLATKGANGQPGWVVTPAPINPDGLCWHNNGQSPGHLGATHAAVPIEYPSTDLANRLLSAANAVQSGVRFVTVNTALSVFHQRTWDCHADGGSLNTTVAQTGQLGRDLDYALSQLLDHLKNTGLLSQTIVVATGEMGRTPHMNGRGGRDHWARAWTALVAGADLPAGAVIGRTDSLGGEPLDSPLRASGLHALVASKLGIA